MIIYSMTATFGKLEQQTLTLEPGLNVITAGNEWGKSTWCAFLAAMFYGLDTRAKSTKTALADKEHYAPWSGSPMSGRIDLRWMGRNITIERKTTGRTPMGDFRAYETDSGLELPEITAYNCGELLLGVERSVFVRTGFIRFRDMNVTEDEALRRRLNNLVTTGEENCEADRLAEELKTLKNSIRYNRTGLLPQLEARREGLAEKCRELLDLEEYNREILRKLDSNEDWRRALENHRDALVYAESQEDARRVDQARLTLQEAWARYEACDNRCRTLPDRDTARRRLRSLHEMQDEQLRLQQRIQELPQEGMPLELSAQFRGMTPEEAREKTREDGRHYEKLRIQGMIPLILGFLLLTAGAVAVGFRPQLGIPCCAAAVAALLWGLIRTVDRNRKRARLEEFYGSNAPVQWTEMAEDYASLLEAQKQKNAALRAERSALEEALRRVRQEVQELGQRSRGDWEAVLAAWAARDEALEDAYKAKNHYTDLKAMVRTVKAPEFQDRMDCSMADTLRLLEECAAERARLENLRGQCQGNMEAIGSKAELEGQLDQVNRRIRKLENTYRALTVAQETLAEARQELQRRFAPGITRRAAQLMEAMTGGRYDRLRIGEDLSLWAGTAQENTMHDARWRSDGTADQLHFSLRLAAAEALLPGIPLVLDDALVRFDDTRLKAALDILRKEAESRQVILFTCQNRESAML